MNDHKGKKRRIILEITVVNVRYNKMKLGALFLNNLTAEKISLI